MNETMSSVIRTLWHAACEDGITRTENLIVTVVGIVYAIVAYLFYIFIWKKSSQHELKSIPGTFTALGIFFTFVSIVHALYQVSKSSGADFNIADLATKLIPAFTTSITGLLWSWIATFIIDVCILPKDEKKEEKEWGNPAKNLKKIADGIIGMSTAFETLKDSIIESNESYKKALENSNSLMSSSNIAIKSQNDKITNFTSDYIKQMGTYFTNAHNQFEQDMRNHITSEIARFSQTLSNLGTQLNTISQGVINGQKETLNASTKDTIAQVTQSIESKVSTSMEQLSNTIIGASLKPLETLKNEIQFVSERIGQICALYGLSTQTYIDALQLVNDQNVSWEKSLASTDKLFNSMEKSQERIDRLLSAINEKDDGMIIIKNEIERINEVILQLQRLNLNLSKKIIIEKSDEDTVS